MTDPTHYEIARLRAAPDEPFWTAFAIGFLAGCLLTVLSFAVGLAAAYGLI
jgi:hypothetical protein